MRTQRFKIEAVMEALGEPCQSCREVIAVLLVHAHSRRGVSETVADLSLRDRRTLERRIRQHGFPQLRVLKNWLRVIVVAYDAEDGMGLAGQAYQAGSDPSVIYRLVKRTCGHSWSSVKGAGTSFWLTQLSQTIGSAVTCTEQGREVR